MSTVGYNRDCTDGRRKDKINLVIFNTDLVHNSAHDFSVIIIIVSNGKNIRKYDYN